MSLRRVVLLIVVAAAAAFPSPTLAQAPPQTVGIRLVDAPTSRANDPRALQYIVDHVAAGTTITRRVEISNDTNTTQLVQVYAAAASVKDGNLLFGEGRAANDLTTWTTVDPPTVNPARGAKATATVTIAVPANAGPGERYGVVWAELPAAVPAGGGIAVVNRVGVRIYLSVGEGSEPVSDFAIPTFEAKRDADGKPAVTATVRNTGGRALDLSGELRLSNGPGGLSAGPFPASLGATLGIGQTEPVLVVLDSAIPPGPWDARMVLRSGTTEREATAKITFPAAPASASKPVKTNAGDESGSRLAPILVGVALVVGLSVLTGVLIRSKRQKEPTPSV